MSTSVQLTTVVATFKQSAPTLKEASRVRVNWDIQEMDSVVQVI